MGGATHKQARPHVNNATAGGIKDFIKDNACQKISMLSHTPIVHSPSGQYKLWLE